jgi:hypothetical protein
MGSAMNKPSKPYTIISSNPKMDTSGLWQNAKEYKAGGVVYLNKEDDKTKVPMDELPNEEGKI